jgi:4-alpha-glucanotransferase
MRKSGILLHPTSLPGRFGIGDLGPLAYRFVDYLASCGQSLWQILPLGPPAEGNSPYQCYSALAGNPLLISPDSLAYAGLLLPEDLSDLPHFRADHVDFDRVSHYKWALLRKAAARFFAGANPELYRAFERFCSEKDAWLDPFAEFLALKRRNGGKTWTEWTRRLEHSSAEARLQKFVQFEFFREWGYLKRYCVERNISIIGDLPIFVAHDSADVWANPGMFDLNEDGTPRSIAGVPPDYFSATGQCWGNPLYRWDVMEELGFRWWVERMRATFETVDHVRLDHFRGFEKYWEIPGTAKTAVVGEWREGPGDKLFAVLKAEFGGLPIIAEDLGFITTEVHDLRDRWSLPGMRVLQFAFGTDDPEHPFKPHNYPRNCVVYTGTHDNNTTVGWFREIASGDRTQSSVDCRRERELALRYLGSDGAEIHWDFIRAALASVGDTAILPMQDLLGLGAEARMNIPAKPDGNWTWRLLENQLDERCGERLLSLTRMYGRIPPPHR